MGEDNLLKGVALSISLFLLGVVYCVLGLGYLEPLLEFPIRTLPANDAAPPAAVPRHYPLRSAETRDPQDLRQGSRIPSCSTASLNANDKLPSS